MRRSISNKCKKLLHIDTSPSSSPPAEHSFRCAAHEKYKPKVDASPQSPPITPATTVAPGERETDDDEEEKEDDEDDVEEEEEQKRESNGKNRPHHAKFTELPNRLDSPSPLEAYTQDGPIVYEGEGWAALAELQSPPPPPPPRPASTAPARLQRPGNVHHWTASPSTFDTHSAVLVLRTLDGCSIPVSNRYLPLYANVLNNAGTSTCRCGGDAYIAVAALLRAWPDFARRVWGLVRGRAVYERDEAVALWLETAKDKLRELLGGGGEIDRSVSDAVQAELRRRAQVLTGVGGATVDQWAREDMETIDWLEGRRSPSSPVGFIMNAFGSMHL